MYPPVVMLIGTDLGARLTPDEVEKLFEFSIQVHDHEATGPAQPIFWLRAESDIRRFWN